jgi:hypothetical protein
MNFPLPYLRAFLPILSLRFFPPDAEKPSAKEKSLRAEVHRRLSSTFKVPAAFWRDVALEASGFFGCQEHEDADGLRGYSRYEQTYSKRK